jgi:hypothetical protein
MSSMPLPVFDHPDWLQAYVRKTIRRFAMGEGGDERAVGNQTLAMFAVVCKKLNKFIQPLLDPRFYTEGVHHPRINNFDVTLMKKFRADSINRLFPVMEQLALKVIRWPIDMGGTFAMEFVFKTGNTYHGRVRVKLESPASISVHVYSMSDQRFKEELEFLVYLTFDTQGWYVVLDNIHGKRIHTRVFHEVLRQRITAAFKRGDFPLA